VVVEVNSDVSVGDCPTGESAATDGAQNIPCSAPAVLIFGELSKELGRPFALEQ
jgi:hypothetical protein